MPPSFSLSIHASRTTPHVPFVRRYLKRAHAELAPPLAELSLAFVGDRVMCQLHERFMSLSGPTDVLTFPLETDSRSRITSGELIICVPEARRRAKALGVPLAHEMLLYAIHGMLHLSGFDDRTARQFSAMHREEDRLLKAIGIGAVFAAAAPTVKAGRKLNASWQRP
ncbi:MAG: rRNA maturation RNase YbeY [Phycisphaerae bacterium]|nr:rRNA maturation RNase YbeY [Phycisphaerae bacterium]